MIKSETCPFVFRVVDNDSAGGHAGTAVLVSNTGKDYGYAVTCWHNIDPARKHVQDWTNDSVVTLPATISAVSSLATDLKKAGRRIKLMGKWSNPNQDLAVLRVPQVVIKEFRLRPAPICFDIRRGAKVIVRGFDRPMDAAPMSNYEGRVPAERDPFTKIHKDRNRFIVQLTVAWQQGESGGGVFDANLGALIGIATDVDTPYALTPRQHETGYAASMNELGESWTDIKDWCQVVEPPPVFPGPWLWWFVPLILSFVLILSLVMYLVWQGPRVPPQVKITCLPTCLRDATDPDRYTLEIPEEQPALIMVQVSGGVRADALLHATASQAILSMDSGSVFQKNVEKRVRAGHYPLRVRPPGADAPETEVDIHMNDDRGALVLVRRRSGL